MYLCTHLFIYYQQLMGEAVGASKPAPSAKKDEGFFCESNLTYLFGQLETLVQVTSPDVTIPEVSAHANVTIPEVSAHAEGGSL